jgi:hypothetical protein
MPPAHDPGAPVVAGGVVVIAAATTVGATQSNQTAAILAFSGALLVALITAYTAYRRQRADLAAERERLELRLGHERRLAEMDHLVALLDEAASAYEAALEKYTSAVWASTTPGVAVDRFNVLSGEAMAGQIQVATLYRRLVLRFSPGDAVTKGYERIRDAFQRGVLAIPDDPREVPVSDPAELRAALDDARAGFNEFGAAGREIIGARRDQPGGG